MFGARKPAPRVSTIWRTSILVLLTFVFWRGNDFSIRNGGAGIHLASIFNLTDERVYVPYAIVPSHSLAEVAEPKVYSQGLSSTWTIFLYRLH